MSEQSTRLGLPYLLPAQAQKHVTHNEALSRLDLLVHLTVQGFEVNDPPNAPQEGEIWVLGDVPSGVWHGRQADLPFVKAVAGALLHLRLAGWRSMLLRKDLICAF